jgi:two-component system, LuxR family, response regulator FixJ
MTRPLVSAAFVNGGGVFLLAARGYLSARRRSVILTSESSCFGHVQINGALMSEIFIVDDDPLVDTALTTALNGEGFSVVNFVEGETFLSAARTRTPGCVVIDTYLPGCPGIDVLKRLDAPHYPAPVLVMSRRHDIPTAVDAIRNGAQDFIEKPFDPAAVAARIRDAIDAWQQDHNEDSPLARVFPGHERLTAREREVLEQIASGASNKETGRDLGISPRTVEVHRARIMDKLAAKNAADLMRIVLRAGPPASKLKNTGT